MRHQNSVFHTVLKHVPWHVFDRLVDAHGADARVRRLATRDQFVALLYGQLAGAQSLREIESGLASHDDVQLRPADPVGKARPIGAAITPARLNDITAAQALPIAAGATYVFDLGLL